MDVFSINTAVSLIPAGFAFGNSTNFISKQYFHIPNNRFLTSGCQLQLKILFSMELIESVHVKCRQLSKLHKGFQLHNSSVVQLLTASFLLIPSFCLPSQSTGVTLLTFTAPALIFPTPDSSGDDSFCPTLVCSHCLHICKYPFD